MSLPQMVEATQDPDAAPGQVKQDESRGVDQGGDRQRFSLVRPLDLARRPPETDVVDIGKLKKSPEDGAGRTITFTNNQNHNVALKLLDEVSSVVPVLVQENQALRLKLTIAKERAAIDIESARELACEWRKTAEEMELRANALEAQLKEFQERAERAEQAANADRELALKSTQDAAEAECLSSLFEDKVLSSFGIGSLFQTAMDKIRTRDAVDAL